MPNNDDYIDRLIMQMDNVEGDDSDDDDDEDMIEGLQAVGALTEVGARKLRGAAARRLRNRKRSALIASRSGGIGAGLPSPPFARSSRSTERRAPLGFTEEGTGARFFTLAAVIGAITTMRAKVSREAHVDRLLIVPSAPGVVIQSIFVGDEEQVLAAGCPVELYSSVALADVVPDNFSPLGPALDFVVVLFNTTAVAITGTIGTKASVKR